jgi:hypothetical protein
VARGSYIARHDSDDWSHPERIAEQVALIESDPRIGFVSCATQFVGPADESLVVVRRVLDPEAATYGLLHERQGPPAHGSVLMRAENYREAGGYREPFHFSQDSDLWLRLAAKSWIAYLPEVRYFHRKDASSTSGARRETQLRFAKIAHRCREARDARLPEDALLEEAMQLSSQLREAREGLRAHDASAEIAMTYLLGSQLARNGDPRARSYLYRVLSAQPWHLKAWIRLVQSLAKGPRV